MGVVAATLVLGACGADTTTASTGSSPVDSTPVGSSVVSPGTSAAPAPAGRTSMRGERYCEVLLVDVVDGQATARVFVSYPLNDCPEDRWQTLDAGAIAAAEGSTMAVLNGPRYWLMDEITKEPNGAAQPTKDFGGIEMKQQATVEVGSMADAGKAYIVREVDRSTVFAFDAGQTVYELTAPDGSVYVMQTWSQQKDPTLVEADLAGLGSRLTLPAGWTYAARALDDRLEVVTTTTAARVIQDDLGNSYSAVG